ncbi:MAG: hypothetical protein SOZ62_01210, partial [Eubacteriales bacterium]|nr:hypothetical protein [Eubacteriales bacterium]
MKKRILSLLLAALMVLCVIPAISLVSYASTPDTVEDYMSALGVNDGDDDERAHFIALIEAYGYDGMPTAKTIKEKLDGYKKFDAEYTNEEIANKLSYSVVTYFPQKTTDEIAAVILGVLNAEENINLTTIDMAKAISKALAADDVYTSASISSILSTDILVKTGLNDWNYTNHVTKLKALNWLDGTTTKPGNNHLILNALNNNKYVDIDTCIDTCVTNGITKTHEDKTAYDNVDEMKAAMKADLIAISSTYVENDETKYIKDYAAEQLMLLNPFRLNGEPVTADEIKNCVQTYLESTPAQMRIKAAMGIALELENLGLYFENTYTTTDMTNENAKTIPHFFDIYDDYNALKDKTTYGSRRVDNFYNNFTDIKVVAEEGEEKVAAAEQFRSYLDYYFTAGVGNYGYYEDLWYDDGHLISFIDYTGLNGKYASAHYKVLDAADPTGTVAGIDSNFAKFIDGREYYAPDGTTVTNSKYLQTTYTNQTDRSYIKIIGGQNIGEYHMLGLDKTTGAYSIEYDEYGHLTSTGTTVLNVYVGVSFTKGDVLSRDLNGLGNIKNVTGNGRLVNYQPNFFADNTLYDGSNFGGYTIESVFRAKDVPESGQTMVRLLAGYSFGYATNAVNEFGNTIGSFRVSSGKITQLGTNSNASGKYYGFPTASQIDPSANVLRTQIGMSFNSLQKKSGEVYTSLNGYDAVNGSENAVLPIGSGYVFKVMNGSNVKYTVTANNVADASATYFQLQYKRMYSQRYYDTVLTDEQKKRNEFADLCYYYGVEITDTIKNIIKNDSIDLYDKATNGFQVGDSNTKEAFAERTESLQEVMWYAENIKSIYAGNDYLYAEIDFTAINSSTVGALEDAALDYIRMIEPRGEDQNAVLNNGNVSKGNRYPQKDKNGNVVKDESGNTVYVTNPYNGYHYYLKVTDGKQRNKFFILMAAQANNGNLDNPTIDKTLATTPTGLYNWTSQNFYTPEQRAAADFVHPFLNKDGTFKAGTANVSISTSYIFTATQVLETGKAASTGQPIYNYATNYVDPSNNKANLGCNKNSGYTVTFAGQYLTKATNYTVSGGPIPDSPNLVRINGSYYRFGLGNNASEPVFNGVHETDTNSWNPNGGMFDLSVSGSFDPDSGAFSTTDTTSIRSYLNGSIMYTYDRSNEEITNTVRSITKRVHSGYNSETIRLQDVIPTYLRIYETDLTEDQIANNHFVDICRYYHVDTDLFRSADSATQKKIVDEFKRVRINGDGVNAQYIYDIMTFATFGVDKAELEQALIFAGFQARTNTNIGLRSVFVLNEDV